MPYQTTLVYDVSLIRKAVFCFWWRSLGLRFVVVIAITAGSLVALIASGDSSWITGAAAAITSMCVLFVAALYVVHYRNSLAKLKAMGRPEALFSADEKAFSMRSGAGEAILPWSSIAEVWQFQNVWLLLFSKAQFFTLPLACVPSDMRAFIVDQVKNSGGKIG